MRAAAGLLLLLLLSGWGIRRSQCLKKRCRLLKELRLTLEQYSIALSSIAPPLEELSRDTPGEFGELLRGALAGTADIRGAWQEAVELLSGQSYCREEEAEMLRELGQSLGTCPAESQLSLLRLYSARLDKLSEQAEKTAEQKGRLYRSGGILAGLGAAVLLL